MDSTRTEPDRVEAKHTRGPWTVSRGAGPDPFAIEAESSTVAHVKLTRPHRAGECIANARLIAAAPDLLSALQAIEAHHIALNERAGRDPERSHTLTLARAVIERATSTQGRSDGED